MAKALTRQRSRRGKTPDARERELKRLRLSVCDDVGFRLYLATYDQPKRRDELIARVIKEAEAEKVRVTRLDLAEAGPETNLIGLLRAHLQKTELPPGWRQAVMVTGIEQRLDYSAGREGFAFLHQANLLRDALPEAAPVPVVLWLSRMASAALPAEAPDLWHWRAANFDFTGDEAPRLELLRELTTLPTGDWGEQSDEHRHARVRMLEDLLAELEREGPPKTKRQAAERATILLDLGIEVLGLRLAAEAVPRAEEALAAYREIGFREGEGLALRVLGVAWQQLGEVRRAIECYKQHLAIARDIGDREGEGAALGNLGKACLHLGEPLQAIEYYQQVLEIARGTGDRRAEVNALTDLGDACYSGGEAQPAIKHYEQSLVIAREIGDRWAEGAMLNNLGRAYAALGEPSRGIEHFEQALAIAREIGNRQGEGVTLDNLGRGYAALGEPLRAIVYHEQALAIAREIGDRRGEGNSLYSIGLAFEQVGERAQAIERMAEALRIYEQTKHPWLGNARAKLKGWQSDAIEGEPQ